MTTKERFALARRLLVLCLLLSGIAVLGTGERTDTAYAARCCQECPVDAAACEVKCAAQCNGTDNECFYPCVVACEDEQRDCFRSCVSCSGGGGGGGGGGGELCEFDGPWSTGYGSYWIGINCSGYSANCESYGSGPGQTYCCDSFGCYFP